MAPARTLFFLAALPVAASEVLVNLFAASKRFQGSSRGPIAREQVTVVGNTSAKHGHHVVPDIGVASNAPMAAATARPVPSAISEGNPAAVSLAAEAQVGAVDFEQEAGAASPAQVSSAKSLVSQLKQETQEVKQHQTNILQMQQALTADVALLRESSTLQRVSATRHGRARAQLQVRQTEKLVKDLSGMLKESRVAAADDAKSLLREAKEVREAADELASEASKQLHSLAVRAAQRSHKQRQTASTETTEQVDAAVPSKVEMPSSVAASPTAGAAANPDPSAATEIGLDDDDSEDQ